MKNQVTQQPKSAQLLSPGNLLQRKCACGQHTNGEECKECRQTGGNVSFRFVQRKTTNIATDVSDKSVFTPSSGGKPLQEEVRATMEKRFGVDFSRVRVHTDTSANRAASDLNSRAFTRQQDIYFAAGHYQPTNQVGLGLLAHELTHVVQQSNGRFPLASSNRVAQARSRLEDEANQVEKSVKFSTAPLVVKEKASGQDIHRSSWLPGSWDELQGMVGGSLEKTADYVIAKIGESADDLMKQLIELRNYLKSLGETIQIPVDVVSELEAAYNEVKAVAPGWIPAPQGSFSGPATQQAAQTIPIAVLFLLLIMAYMIVVYYANPETQKHVQRFIRELSKARPRPVPVNPQEEPPKKPEPKQEPKNEPKETPKPKPLGPDPIPESPKLPGPYPLYWATQLGPVTQTEFVRTKSPERDLDEQENARMLLRYRGYRDPEFPPSKYHVHHVVPLFLGGPDNLRTNGTILLGGLHLKGHRILQIQPQMLTPPPPLPPLPVDLYQHPPGILYKLVGYKKDIKD